MLNWNVNTVYGSKAGAVGSINTNKDMPDSVKASILSLVAGLPEPAPAPAYAANILVATSGNHEIGGAQVVNRVNISLFLQCVGGLLESAGEHCVAAHGRA